MTIETWGLLFALMPLGQQPSIESMNFQPAISKADCINQAKPHWYDYHNKQNKKNTSLYTFCLNKHKSTTDFYEIVCNSVGVCTERLRY